jgi:hypothetical protein
MTSIKGWTAVLRGYFDTSILPTVSYVAPHPEAGLPRAVIPPLNEIREKLLRMLVDQYGSMANEENAVAALKDFVPGWWQTYENAAGGEVNHWWSWAPESLEFLRSKPEGDGPEALS